MAVVERASTRSPISRHGSEYSVAPTLAWMSGPTFAADQVASTNGAAGNGASAAASTAANTAAGPAQRAARPRTGHLGAPPPGGGAHRLQRGELPSPPERVTHIRHRPFDPGLVLGLERPRRVDQRPV